MLNIDWLAVGVLLREVVILVTSCNDQHSHWPQASKAKCRRLKYLPV